MMKLSVVIVSYNVRPFLLQTLDSVMRACEGLDADVWVVDNASPDDSVAQVRQHYPQVRLIANEDNIGFARANNMAIRQSDAEYVLLLNPDTIIGEDVLSTCLDFMDQHAEVGGVGIHMLNRDGSFAWESRRGVPTPTTAFYKMSGLANMYPNSRRFGHYHMRYLDMAEANQIEVMSGAFTMLRRKALDEVGLLDEQFFMYGEDVDLSYRLLQGGWQNWYLPVRMLHYKGESTKLTSFRYVRNFYMAMIIFYRKHFAHRHRLASMLIEAAVYVVGMMSMMKKLAYRVSCFVAAGVRRLLGRSNTPEQKRSLETMLFFGNSAGWEALQPIIRRANIPTIYYHVDSVPSGHLSVDSSALAFTYVTYQIEVTSYATMLEWLSQGHDQGLRASLGTFSLQTKTLILPNDVFE